MEQDDDDMLDDAEQRRREALLFEAASEDDDVEDPFADAPAARAMPSRQQQAAAAAAAFARPVEQQRFDNAFDEVQAVVRPAGGRGRRGGGNDPAPKRRRYGPLRSPLEQQRERRVEEDRRAGVHESGYRCELCRLSWATRLVGPENDLLRKQYETLHRRLGMVAPDELYRHMVESFNAQLREFEQVGASRLRPWSVAAVRHHVEHCIPAYAGVLAAVRARQNLVEAQEHFFRTRCFFSEEGGGGSDDDDDDAPVLDEDGLVVQLQDERAMQHYLRVQQQVRNLTAHIQQQMHALQQIDFSSLHAIGAGGRVKQEDKGGGAVKTYRRGPLQMDAKAQLASGRLSTAIMGSVGGGVR